MANPQKIGLNLWENKEEQGLFVKGDTKLSARADIGSLIKAQEARDPAPSTLHLIPVT